ncbi:hypothetical protein O181_117159 [Austropuccinia psidii MF-1]|uniref:Uncharacterized protein n=1 Tax=Austropuccinia psidii MF-1 TaxID=1389203 RepID=A0A9Q3PX84_9BASI|nr:hypothetical protein [Austropuccinia psidii MF-1]
MDSASSSRIPHNSKESKEEILNEETMQEPEYVSDVEGLNKRMLEIQEEIIELLQKEGKNKSQVLMHKASQESLDQKGHNRHFQGPWPHQHHSLCKDQTIYQRGLIFMHRLQTN